MLYAFLCFTYALSEFPINLIFRRLVSAGFVYVVATQVSSILSLFPPPSPLCTLSRPSASRHDASPSSGSSSLTQNVVGEGRELLSLLKYGNLNNDDFILAYGFGRRSD